MVLGQSMMLEGQEGGETPPKDPHREAGQSWNEMGAGSGGYCSAENRG